MLQTAKRLLTAEKRERREAAELFLHLALYAHSDSFVNFEELHRMNFRIIAKELTGSDSFTALANHFKNNEIFELE